MKSFTVVENNLTSTNFFFGYSLGIKEEGSEGCRLGSRCIKFIGERIEVW